jgi:hypothetical protein
MPATYTQRQQDLAVEAAIKARSEVQALRAQLVTAYANYEDSVALAVNEAGVAVSRLADALDLKTRQSVYDAARRAHERRFPTLPFD